MDSHYSNRLYIERNIDQKLWEIARRWLGTSRIQWVSLQSAPGLGNSWLLKHLQELALNYKLGFEDIAIILVKGDDPEHPPKRLGPLGRELYYRYEHSRMRFWRRLKRHLREAGLGRLITFSLIGLICLLLVFFLKGLDEYNHVNDMRILGVGLWWNNFLYEFLPQNWPKFPIWFLTEYIVTVPLAIALAVYSALVYRAHRKRLSSLEDPENEELKHFESKEDLAKELIEICHKCRGVMLLIDDAHRLPENEKQLLIDMVNPEKESALEAFNETYRILIVTAESQITSWEGRPTWIEEFLEVPAFSLIELRDIARDQLTEPGDEKARDASEALLEQAQQNVHSLFAHREKQLVAELGRKFLSIESVGYENRFGLAEMIAYMVALQKRSIPTGQLVESLESPSSNAHLAAFGLRLLKDQTGLFEEFVKSSSLVQQVHNKTCYFNMLRCQALRQWLAENSAEHKRLLAQAHYFWYCHFQSKANGQGVELTPDNINHLSSDQQQNLLVGVWHAVQVGILLNNAPEVLAQAPGLTDTQRRELSHHVAASILTAAALYRCAGNMIESNDLIQDALDWLRGLGESHQEELLESAAAQLWWNYWPSGSASTRQKISGLADEFPVVTEKLCWLVNQRFEELLQGKSKLSPPPDENLLSDSGLRNLHRLTETLWDIRQTHGLIKPALSDAKINVREPVKAAESTMAESHLRQLQIAAWNQCHKTEALAEAMDQWRQQLNQTQPSADHLGSEMLHTYNKARYWHLLAEVWRHEMELIEGLPEAEEEAHQELLARIQVACLTSPSENLSLSEYIWQEAQSAYERAIQIAALLNWRSMVMEVSFHLGVLLQNHTPKSKQTDSPPWWERWDNLFGNCIELERDLQWIIYTPIMHRIRWKFFEEKDHERCVEDAYNAFQSAKRSQYPSELVLDWHQQVSARLTNFSDSEADRRRDAELHEVWAHDLAHLPEAAKHRDFGCLEYEQADNLTFAAQARRLLREFDYAERLLDEADSRMEKGLTEQAKEGEEDQEVRDLKISLKMQRAWLLDAQHRDKEYHQAILEIWRQLQSTDQICAIVLVSLLQIEHETKKLDEAWPPVSGAPIFTDPENENLSLPAEWFEGDSPIHLEKRFEFRFYQLLQLVNFIKRVAPSGSASELPFISVLNNPERLFSTHALQVVASNAWFRMNNFGDAALNFARLGLEYESPQKTETRAFIINLLEAVQYYFAEVMQVDRDELEALKLLMRYNPDSDSYRLQYVKVLTESKYLLKHEQLAREATEEPSWLAIANQVNNYLSILVDATLLSNWTRMGLQRANISQGEFLSMQKQRREILRHAKATYETGEQVKCQQLLQPALPTEQSPWVFLEDLQVLDLWLRCARAQSSRENGQSELNRRASQLRKATLQFIRQFELVIKEKEAQHLATEILKAVQR